jgi:diphthine-ammonia ligase
MEDVANITLLLPSLAPEVFAAANKAYAKLFGVSPPSRACVGVDLPEGVGMMLECIACKDNTRRALHVQSLSYWAPANIGPYSQAVTVRLVFCDARCLSNYWIRWSPMFSYPARSVYSLRL